MVTTDSAAWSMRLKISAERVPGEWDTLATVNIYFLKCLLLCG